MSKKRSRDTRALDRCERYNKMAEHQKGGLSIFIRGFPAHS